MLPNQTNHPVSTLPSPIKHTQSFPPVPYLTEGTWLPRADRNPPHSTLPPSPSSTAPASPGLPSQQPLNPSTHFHPQCHLSPRPLDVCTGTFSIWNVLSPHLGEFLFIPQDQLRSHLLYTTSLPGEVRLLAALMALCAGSPHSSYWLSWRLLFILLSSNRPSES